jgi:5-methyltetrahydrofolate--homocysteine methyltransferase
MERARPAKKQKTDQVGVSDIGPAPDYPTPPFWGVKTVREIPLESVFPHLHKPELYRLSWGAKNTHGAEWTKLEAEFEDRLRKMQKAAIAGKTLQPQAVYGYFPAQRDGDALVIYDPKVYTASGELTEIERFRFPRQPDGDFLCLADYYAPIGSGQVDVCPLQIVTVGNIATETFDVMQNSDNYSEAYFFHGLAVQTAEATATYMNRHINRELNIPAERGLRYSWGYPACPDLDDHATLFRLLPEAESEIGMVLSSAFQLIPEQSTAAIVTHHPAAKYFSVGVNRVEQLVGS